MKKFIAALLLSVMTLSLISGCGKKEGSNGFGTVGVISKDSQEYLSEALKSSNLRHINYDSYSSLVLALNKGEIESASLPSHVAQYLINQDDSFVATPSFEESKKHPLKIFGVSFLFRDEDTDLRDQFNLAIDKYISDGLEGELFNKYVEDVLKNKSEPEKNEFNTYPGAQTITIAITGDLPPFDYVDAAGNPAGYNIAVIKTLADYLQINVELISVDAGARAIALSSGKCDAVFWTRVQPDKDQVKMYYPDVDESLFETNEDIPEGTITSKSYAFLFSTVVTKKK